MITRNLLVTFAVMVVFSLLQVPVSAATGIPTKNNILRVYAYPLGDCVGFTMELRGDDRGSKSSHTFTKLDYSVETFPEVMGVFNPAAGTYCFQKPDNGSAVKVVLTVEGHRAEIVLLAVTRLAPRLPMRAGAVLPEEEATAVLVGNGRFMPADYVSFTDDGSMVVGFETDVPAGVYSLFVYEAENVRSIPHIAVAEP